MAEDVEATKQRLIATAREQVGAHYLWSAAGNTPGNKDGASYRPQKAALHPNIPNLDTFDFEKPNAPDAKKFGIQAPMLFAAFADTSDFGRLACGGRPLVIDTPFALEEMGGKANLAKALALKWKALTADQLKELSENAANPSAFRWPRPNSSLGNNSARSTIWGESCVDVRHFDCIGFINWCLSTTLNKPVQYGIPNFLAKTVGTSIPIGSAQACDILTIGATHIGWVTEEKTAIEAMDVLNGVIESPISKGRWVECFRLPDSTWK